MYSHESITSNPKISVVIPAYNAELYLADCIASVLNQSYKNIEIIIINDGSSDSTEEISKQFSDKIIYVYQQNQGASIARNTGINQAQGDYIAFLDADDLWHFQKIERQLLALRQHPEAAYCDTACSRQSKEILKKRLSETVNYETTSDFGYIFKNPYTATSSWLIARNLIQKTGTFDPSLKTAEDVDFILKIAYYNPNVVHITEQLVYIHKNELSLGHSLRTYDDNLLVVNRFISTHTHFSNTNKELIQEAKRKIYKDFGITLQWSGENKEAKQKLKIALSYGFDWETMLAYIKSSIPTSILQKLKAIKNSVA